MAVPTGTASFSDIQAEHGGSNPVSLSEYYRGGIYVTDGPSENAGVPTSGEISVADLRGSVLGDPSLTDFTWSDISGTDSASTVDAAASGANMDVDLYHTRTFNTGATVVVQYRLDSGSWNTILAGSGNTFSYADSDPTVGWQLLIVSGDTNVDINVYNGSDNDDFVGGFNADILDSEK